MDGWCRSRPNPENKTRRKHVSLFGFVTCCGHSERNDWDLRVEQLMRNRNEYASHTHAHAHATQQMLSVDSVECLM